jgi:hypothetical protein
VTENKMLTDSPDHQLNKNRINILFYQARNTQNTVVPEN